MKLFTLMKDGGKESRVWGFFIAELKRLFSIVMLHFLDGSREAYHSHAFNSISWVIKGKLTEHNLDGSINEYKPSLKPIITKRGTFHKVVSTGDTWVLSFRGPWSKTWKEFLPEEGKFIELTHGRNVVS